MRAPGPRHPERLLVILGLFVVILSAAKDLAVTARALPRLLSVTCLSSGEDVPAETLSVGSSIAGMWGKFAPNCVSSLTGWAQGSVLRCTTDSSVEVEQQKQAHGSSENGKRLFLPG